jgi:hypothetical protein
MLSALSTALYNLILDMANRSVNDPGRVLLRTMLLKFRGSATKGTEPGTGTGTGTGAGTETKPKTRAAPKPYPPLTEDDKKVLMAYSNDQLASLTAQQLRDIRFLLIGEPGKTGYRHSPPFFSKDSLVAEIIRLRAL